MAAIVTEMAISRSLEVYSTHRKYIVRGATSEADATTAFAAYISALGLVNGMSIDASSIKLEEVGELLFYGECTWKLFNPEKQPVNSFHISFDIGTQTQHLTQSISTVNKYTSSIFGTIDFKGAIGVDEDGGIQGVDIIIPFPTFQINYTFDAATITDAYIQTLVNTVGKVNSAIFHNFAIGTLLLTKVSGQQREDTSWDISFGFSACENQTGMTIGGITGIDKKGWECLWVYYVTKDVTYGGVSICQKTPIQVNIEQVYKTANYGTNLGI